MGVAWLTLLLVAVTFLVAGAAFFGLYYVQLSEEDRQEQGPEEQGVEVRSPEDPEAPVP